MVIFGLVMVVVLAALGAPIWGACLAGGSISLIVGQGMDPLMIARLMYEKVHNFSLVAIPLFILAGQVLGTGGIATRLVVFLNRFMGHISGGPAYVVIVTMAIIAAMSSGSLAAVAAFAPIMVPAMTNMGYSRRFAVGLMVASSVLGTTIPPSIPLIIFGFITETSITDLYSAALIPGIVEALLLAAVVYFHSRRGHYTPPPPSSWAERGQAFKEAWPALLLPVAVLVPIYGGWITATEAAGVACAGAIFLGLVVYRELSLKALWQSLRTTVMITGAIGAILMGAFVLNLTLTYERLPYELGEAIIGAGLNKPAFLAVVSLVFLGIGAFLPAAAILIILPPILWPAIMDLGISPLVFGVFTVVALDMASITPPYGMTLFAASSIIKEDYGYVARACFMFYPALIICMLFIAYIPQLSLWLPPLLR